jgi:hypothetical protein
LNLIETLNCHYCAYGNGLLAYAREVAGRTEQYWCPVRHAARAASPHRQYRHFATYDDAEGYQRELPILRRDLRSDRGKHRSIRRCQRHHILPPPAPCKTLQSVNNI